MDTTASLKLILEADKAVKQAKQNKIVSTYSIAKGTTNAMLLRGPLAHIICMRLVALQYLTKDEVEANLPSLKQALSEGQNHPWQARFTKAVTLLQEEAGLKADAWLSEKTFNAIQNVYAFEEKTHVTHWQNQNKQHFFCRAIFARLQVLGLIPPNYQSPHVGQTIPSDNQYQQFQGDMDGGLRRFKQIIEFVSGGDSSHTTQLGLLELLFSTDDLTAFLVSHSPSLAQRLRQVGEPHQWENKSIDLPALTLRLLMAQARIEVWLNGYGSAANDGNRRSIFDPGQDISARTYSRDLSSGIQQPNRANDITLSRELLRIVEFWDDGHRLINTRTDKRKHFSKKGLRREIANRKIRIAGIALRTLKISEALNQHEATNQPDSSEALTQQVAKLDEASLQSPVWQEEHGASLFDGIKRAWRWVVGKAKALFNFFADKLRLLVRAIKSLAFKGLAWFRKLGLIFAHGTKHIMRKTWYRDEKAQVLRDTDFDVAVWLHPSASKADAIRAKEVIVARTVLFKAATALTFLIAKAMRLIRSLFVNPAIGAVKALLLLSNFDNLLNAEDKRVIQLAFEQTRLVQ